MPTPQSENNVLFLLTCRFLYSYSLRVYTTEKAFAGFTHACALAAMLNTMNNPQPVFPFSFTVLWTLRYTSSY